MAEKNLEKRLCVRFKIPGAEIKYKKESSFFKKSDFGQEPLPLVDISRGGIRFFAHEIPRFDSRITILMFLPEESEPLVIEGMVRWYSPNPDARYKYQVGVQFLPYGEGKDENSPDALNKIIELEDKFLAEMDLPDDIPETV